MNVSNVGSRSNNYSQYANKFKSPSFNFVHLRKPCISDDRNILAPPRATHKPDILSDKFNATSTTIFHTDKSRGKILLKSVKYTYFFFPLYIQFIKKYISIYFRLIELNYQNHEILRGGETVVIIKLSKGYV